MIRCDAVVVGGGPAGSTCARLLRKAGWDVIVVDRARFPRDKVCAGWLTPEVFRLLELDPEAYRTAGLTLQEIRGFRTGPLGARLIETSYPRVVSYAIRRCEFDGFLLKRARVRVLDGAPVETLQRHGNTWIVDGRIEAAVVIGAGGHFCPVARHMRRGADTSRPVVAKETEFRATGSEARRAGETPALFFCRDMAGYGWVVRKGDYLNVGLGRRNGLEFSSHLRAFVGIVEDQLGFAIPADARWKGHAYFASGAGVRPLAQDGLVLVGDAAGLAYPESGEGIRPAVESGRLAAELLAASGRRADAGALDAYAATIRHLHPPRSPSPAAVAGLAAALGRLLLLNHTFTRRIVLNRWFLRTAAATLPFLPPVALNHGVAHQSGDVDLGLPASDRMRN